MVLPKEKKLNQTEKALNQSSARTAPAWVQFWHQYILSKPYPASKQLMGTDPNLASHTKVKLSGKPQDTKQPQPTV